MQGFVSADDPRRVCFCAYCHGRVHFWELRCIVIDMQIRQYRSEPIS